MANEFHLKFFLCMIFFFIATTKGQNECGDVTSAKEYTFLSPSTYTPKCTLRVYVSDSKVTQLRLDFKTFSIAQPEKLLTDLGSYQCLRDSFTVESLSRDYSPDVPGKLLFDKLCGENSGQHIYIPVDAVQASETIQLTFDLQQPDEDMESQVWSIKVTQLDCNDIYDKDLCAPEGCLQYYPDPSGTFESFNYNSGAGRYQGFLNYAICFKRYRSVCSIQYNADGFQLPANDFNQEYGNIGCNLPTNDPSNPFSRDYLFIPDATTANGMDSSLWCGTSLLNNLTTTKAPGPLYVFFHTDKYANEFVNGREVGFRISYQTSTECGGMKG